MKTLKKLYDELNDPDLSFDRKAELLYEIRELEIELGIRNGHIEHDSCDCENCGA